MNSFNHWYPNVSSEGVSPPADIGILSLANQTLSYILLFKKHAWYNET